MKKIYLFRHGETSWNASKDVPYCEENHNVYLNEVGIKQAEKLAEYLQDKNIQKIYTSKLKRANQTGKIVADFIDVEYETVDGLEEYSYYDDSLLGITRRDIIELVKQKYGKDVFDLWKHTKNTLLDFRPFNCETKREARNRISNTVFNICKNDNNSTIGIASHGTILREFLRMLDFEDDSSLKNCEVVEAEFENDELKIIGRIRCND